MTHQLSFYVHGLPGPQGSKRHVGNGRMIEMSKKVKPWRAAVQAAATDAARLTDHHPYTGPVAVRILFYLPRPKHHYRTGRHSTQLKPDAPVHVHTRPDVDKLLRSTFDALTAAGIWADDSLAAKVHTEKVYAIAPDTVGARIELGPMAVTR